MIGGEKREKKCAFSFCPSFGTIGKRIAAMFLNWKRRGEGGGRKKLPSTQSILRALYHPEGEGREGEGK